MPTEVTTEAGTFTVEHDRCWFEIDGVPSSTPAWLCSTPMGLLRPHPMRNRGGRLIPRSQGRKARKLWGDSYDAVMPFNVFATADPFGDPGASLEETLVENLLYLNDTLGSVPETTDSTRTCIVHLPDGSTRSGPVQCELDWPDTAGPPLAVATLTVTVLAGALTELGSA